MDRTLIQRTPLSIVAVYEEQFWSLKRLIAEGKVTVDASKFFDNKMAACMSRKMVISEIAAHGLFSLQAIPLLAITCVGYVYCIAAVFEKSLYIVFCYCLISGADVSM